MRDEILLILILGAITYITRASGHFIVARFGSLHPRVEAALEAVPAAVIATLVIPPVLDGGTPERLGFAVAVLVSLRFSVIVTVIIGISVVAGARALGL